MLEALRTLALRAVGEAWMLLCCKNILCVRPNAVISPAETADF